MDTLTKVASICASGILKKKATSFRQATDAINEGAEAALKRDELLKAIRGPKEGIPTWAKLLAGLGVGKTVLDHSGNKPSTSWRR